MKKVLALCISLVITLSCVAPVLAMETTQRPLLEKARNGSSAAMKEQKMQERVENKTDNLKERAKKEINRRLESLNRLIKRINEFKKLSAAQKESLTSPVTTEITKLTALLTKIEADTDAEVLKTDVKSIVDSYRIYALFMPKIEILGAADRALSTADQMSSHAAELETKINTKKAEGKNVSELETFLTDMKAKIAHAKTQAQGAIDAVTPLMPDGYPGNKTTLQSARQMIVTAIKDLNTARQDGRKIIVGLMKLGKSTTP